MRKFSLDKEMNIEVKATFIAKGENTPVTGSQYNLRLFDKDIFGDDYLGECKLNEAGEGRIILGIRLLEILLTWIYCPTFILCYIKIKYLFLKAR